MNKEQILAGNVAQYLLMKYPNSIFRFDVGADMKLTIGQASRVKKLHGKWNKGFPDLFIAQPNKYYAGLFIELKHSENSPFKKDGELKKDEHIHRQALIHQTLRNAGYEAKFVTGLQEAIEVIEDYMEAI